MCKGDAIKCYFHKGYSYDEILLFLSQNHNINISKRQLNRLLREQNLFRRYKKTNLNTIIAAIDSEIKTSRQCFGIVL